MRKFGMVVGALIAVFGVSVMATPLRTYFIISWIIGCVLLCNGLGTVINGLAKKSRSITKCIAGLTTAIIGIVLLATDFEQTLIVYLVAGGIMISGLVETIYASSLKKREEKYLKPAIMGVISFIVGLVGIFLQDATVTIIGIVVGYYIVRIGLSVFTFARKTPVEIEAEVIKE